MTLGPGSVVLCIIVAVAVHSAVPGAVQACPHPLLYVCVDTQQFLSTPAHHNIN